jgi:hypothetical protein
MSSGTDDLEIATQYFYDPVLQQVPAARRHTLIAVPAVDQPDRYTWQIVLQGGSNETVFFAL